MTKKENICDPIFLDTPKIQIRELLAASEQGLLAVAYWGAGAARELGLNEIQNERRKKFKIYCDLFSGACNPNELQKILNLGYPLYHIDHLHSKVVCTPKGVIVGSANASSNGLGFEGRELARNIEASFISRNRYAIRQVKIWFNNLPAIAEKIDCEMLKRALKIYKHNRERRPYGSRNKLSIIDQMKANPEGFKDRNWYLWCYSPECFSKEEDNAIEEKGFETGLGSRLSAYSLISEWNKPNTIIIEFNLEKNKLLYRGVWRLLDIPPRKLENHFLHFCKKERNVGGVSMRGAKSALKIYIEQNVDLSRQVDESISLYDVAKWIASG